MENYWIPESEKAGWDAHYQNMVKGVLWGRNKDYVHDPKNDVKWAWVKVGSDRKLIGVNNKTMVGYETEGYEFQYDKIQSYDEFERWATTFDL